MAFLRFDPATRARYVEFGGRGHRPQSHGSNLSSWLHTLQVNHAADFERISKWVRSVPEIESLGTVVTQAGTTFLTSRERFLQSPITVFEASAGQLKFIALASLIYSPFGVPLISLEEPENHLHPRLLSLLVEMANQRRIGAPRPGLADNRDHAFPLSRGPPRTRRHRACLQTGRRDEVPSSRIRGRVTPIDPRVREYARPSLVQRFIARCVGVQYGLIAEDTFIMRSVPVLVSRLVDLEGDRVECRRMNGKPDFIANFWRVVKEFQFRYPAMHRVLAICDADSGCVVTLAEELRARATARLGALPFSLVFHVSSIRRRTSYAGLRMPKKLTRTVTPRRRLS